MSSSNFQAKQFVVSKKKKFCTYALKCPYPIGWGCRIYRLHLCRGVRPPPNKCPDMTVNNLILRLK